MQFNVQYFKIPTEKEIRDYVRSVPELKYKALLCALYLTAGRVSEVVNDSRTVNFHIDRYKKTWKRSKKDKILKRIEQLKDEYKPMCKSNIEVVNISGVRFMKVVLWTLKNRKYKWRVIPVNAKRHRFMVNCLLDYCDTVEGNVLFNFSRQWVWRIFREKFKIKNPHFYRHVRITHLHNRGFNPEELRLFAGWTDNRMSSSYVHPTPDDLAKKMI